MPRPSETTPIRPSPLAEGAVKPVVATPILREPAAPVHTPEPDKRDRSVKQDSYRELGLASGAGATLTSGAVAAAAATRRSVSDNASREAQRASPQLTEATPRRSTSNTSLVRLRTPEPLTFRPESPGSIRSWSGTPPLRAKRVSGDLRSLSQRGTPAAAGIAVVGAVAGGLAAAAAAAAGAQSSGAARDKDFSSSDHHATAQNNTPVANEGRVRAKDMADVYVSNIPCSNSSSAVAAAQQQCM